MRQSPPTVTTEREMPSLEPTIRRAVELTEDRGVTRWEITYYGHSLEFRAKVMEHLLDRVRRY